MELTLHHNLKLYEFSDYLKTQYISINTNDLVTLRKLILRLDKYKKTDFGNLTINEIELKYPYFLLHYTHSSIPVFLLYKKFLYPKLD